MKRILEIAKYVAAISVIAGAALYFDSLKDDVGSGNKALMDTLVDVQREIHSVKYDLDDYKKLTNTHRVYRAEQTSNLIKEIHVLKRNQNAIINNSTEQKEILNEIKNRRLINGIVMEPVKSIAPEMLVYIE